MTWLDDAACRETPTHIFYPSPPTGRRPDAYIPAAHYAQARAICNQCPVRDRCLDDAMAAENGQRFGMFGGLTERERASLPWRLCVECSTRFPARRNGKGGSVPKFCGDECRDASRRRQYEAELERQRRARLEEVA